MSTDKPSEAAAPSRRFLNKDELEVVKGLSETYQELDKGSFACSGILATPHVNVDKLKLFVTSTSTKEGEASVTHALPLPLSDKDAQAIYDTGVASPFGRGAELVHDNTYREAHEIKPPNFALSHEVIGQSGLLAHLKERLGYTSPLRARLNKLNAYTTGGFFKAHKDTPNGEAHIGTLILCLPSKFTGGELLIRQNGSTVTFDWAQQVIRTSIKQRKTSTSYDIAWGFLFSDCEHEILPVQSGTRVTISFDILVEKVKKGRKADIGMKGVIDSRQSSIRQAFDKLMDPSFLPEGGELAFGLLHGYAHEDESTSFKETLPARLKSCDGVLLRVIEEVGLKTSFIGVYDLEGSFEETESDSDTASDAVSDSSYSYCSNGKRKRSQADEVVDDITYDRGMWTSDGFFCFGGAYCGPEGPRDLGVEKDKNLVWISKPQKFQIENSYINYGNEPSQSTIYVAVALKVVLPPAAKRHMIKNVAASAPASAPASGSGSDSGSGSGSGSGSDSGSAPTNA